MLALLAVPASADAARVKGKLEGFRLLRNPVWAEAKETRRGLRRSMGGSPGSRHRALGIRH